MQKLLITALAIFALANGSSGQGLESQGDANTRQDHQSRTEAFRGIGKLINRRRSVWHEVFGWPLYGKANYDVWSTGGISRKQERENRGTPPEWRSKDINMTVFWGGDFSGPAFQRETNGSVEFGKVYGRSAGSDPLPEEINFYPDPDRVFAAPLTLNEAKELASYFGLQYDEDLKEFFDQAGQATGRCGPEGGTLTINITR
jgi:hypothetical protein